MREGIGDCDVGRLFIHELVRLIWRTVNRRLWYIPWHSGGSGDGDGPIGTVSDGLVGTVEDHSKLGGLRADAFHAPYRKCRLIPYFHACESRTDFDLIFSHIFVGIMFIV